MIELLLFAMTMTQPTPWTHDDVVDALAGQSVMTRRIVYCECSNRDGANARYDPYAGMGTTSFLGCAQLMQGRGNGLDIFYRWGYTDPFNPYEAVAFINEVQAKGMLNSQYPNTQRGCQGSP